MQSARVPGLDSGTEDKPGEGARAGDDGAREARSEGSAVSRAELLALYTAMLRARRIEHRLAALYREGAIGTHRPAAKDEAVLVGAAAALRSGDWLFTGEGHAAAALVRGVPVETLFHHVFGDASDPAKGRTVPSRLAYRRANVVAGGTSNGAHLTHAAGLAWAAKMRKAEVIALALFDATIADTAEFHNGVNFAGVFKAPVVFVCRSGGGVLASAPSVAPPLVDRGVAYGIRAVACDGGDVVAVLRAVRAAMAHASRGGGPTLLDAVIAADGEDPLLRARRLLDARELLPDQASVPPTDHARLEAAIAAEVAAAVHAAESAAPPASASLFDDVYAVMPRHLNEQRADRANGEAAKLHRKGSI